MTPQQRLESDLKTAMKAKDKERLLVLRMLLTDVKNKKIELGRDLDDDDFIAAVRRGLKQRQDSESQYRDAGRDDLADKEKAESAILEEFLPQQASESDVLAAIEEFVAAEGLEKGPKSIGVVMKAMMAKFGATADGGTINRAARQVLTS